MYASTYQKYLNNRTVTEDGQVWSKHYSTILFAFYSTIYLLISHSFQIKIGSMNQFGCSAQKRHGEKGKKNGLVELDP